MKRSDIPGPHGLPASEQHRFAVTGELRIKGEALNGRTAVLLVIQDPATLGQVFYWSCDPLVAIQLSPDAVRSLVAHLDEEPCPRCGPAPQPWDVPK